MIVEGVVTSLDAAGNLNVAPMGPIVEGDFNNLVLRPFQSSTTFRNLHETRCGVFHVVDSVDLLARAAIGRLSEMPDTQPASCVDGRILNDCCRWFEFRITDCDLSAERSVMQAEIVARGEQRPFLGLNRARNAILEAAILATRVHLLPKDEIESQMTVLRSAVEKTGGVVETEAFTMLQDYTEQAYERS